VPGVAPPQVQDPALALVEPHQVPLCRTLQPAQVKSLYYRVRFNSPQAARMGQAAGQHDNL